MHRILGVVVSLALVLAAGVPLRSAADKPTFTVGWSIYAGWTPYYYMQKSGILRKWADKYVSLVRLAAHAACINAERSH